MIFSNLSGTTSDEFKIGSGGNGKVISRNAYDIFWRGNADSTQQNINVKLIPNGTDLNTMKTIGQYYVINNTDAPTLINCPTNRAFIMTIEPSIGITYSNKLYVVQKITDFNGIIYCRGYDGNGDLWGGWTRTLPNLDINSLALKSELPTIEEGTIVPDAVDGYTVKAANVRYTAYKYSNKTVFDVYGVLALVANNPIETYAINNLPFTFDSFRYPGWCQFDIMSNVTTPMNSQYLHGACRALNGYIDFKLYAYNSSNKSIMGWGVNSFVGVANTMFNLSFGVRIG